MKKVLIGLVAALLTSSTALAQHKTDAETIFDRYQALERTFDSSVADLYCDAALIRNIRTYPDGRQRVLEIPASKYKALIRAAMPLAKARGDYSTYSAITFNQESGNTRIEAIRHSVMKNYSSPISILVGPCNGGGFAILEELSESQP